MSAREITHTLPEALSEQLAAQALIRQFAIVPESELPPVLWAIARSDANPDKVALYDVLTERHLDGTLTPEGLNLLQQLRDELEAVTLRKAQAFALLQSRGVKLPSLDNLHNQTSSQFLSV